MIEFLVCKYAIIKFNSSKAKDSSDVVNKITNFLEQFKWGNFSERERIIFAKAYYLLSEAALQYMKASLPKDQINHLFWALEQFQARSLHFLQIKTACILQNQPSVSNQEKLMVLRIAITAARKLGKKDLEIEFTKQSANLKSVSRLIMMNNLLVTEDSSSLKSTVGYNKNLHDIVFAELKDSGKNLILETYSFSMNRLCEEVREATDCKVYIVDMPVVWEDWKESSDFSLLNNNILDSNSASNKNLSFDPEVSVSDIDNQRDSEEPSQAQRSEGGQTLPVLLILGNREHLEIPEGVDLEAKCCIVSMDFQGKIKSNLDIVNIWLVREFKYLFVSAFVTYLVKKKCKVHNAVKKAKNYACEKLGEAIRKRVLVDLKVLWSHPTNDPEVPSPQYNIDTKEYFSSAVQSSSLSEGKAMFFPMGQLETQPSPYTTRSLSKSADMSYVRDELLHSLIQEFKAGERQFKIMNIFGKKGRGKTTIVHHLMNQLTMRNLFKDGIYYFNLAECTQRNVNENVKELMNKQLGMDFTNNQDQFFMNKDMLVVLDDFYLASDSRKVALPLSLIKSLQINKIQLILVTVRPFQMEEYNKSIITKKIDALSNEESLLVFLLGIMMRKRCLFKFSWEIFQDMENLEIISECKGNPKMIFSHLDYFLEKGLKYVPGKEGFVKKFGKQETTSNSMNDGNDQSMDFEEGNHTREKRNLDLKIVEGMHGQYSFGSCGTRGKNRRKSIWKTSNGKSISHHSHGHDS